MAALARPFATFLGIATSFMLVIGLLLWARSGFATPPYVFMRGPIGEVTFLIVVATQVASGWVLAVRRPDLPIGRLALVFAFVVCTAVLTNGYLALVERGGPEPIDGRWLAWLPSWIGFSGATLTAIAIGLMFPDGRLGASPWPALFGLSVVGGIFTSLAMAFLPGPLMLYPSYANPLGAPEMLTAPLRVLGVAGIALLSIGVVSVAVSLIGRYRQADAVVRVQLRLYLVTSILLVTGFLAFQVALATVPHGSVVGEAVLVLFLISAGLPPIALFISISLYRLFDIDQLLSRAFVFGTLTAILAGLYTASIRLFNAVFTAVTGENSDAALVITTLVIAASFTPIKRRLETLVDRRFRAPGTPEPGLEGAVTMSTQTAAGAMMLDDAVVGRIAAAVIGDPAFGAALESRFGPAVAPLAALQTVDAPDSPQLEGRSSEHE